MADPISSPADSKPTILAQSLAQLNEQIPEGKKGAVLVGLEWKYGLPFMKVGTAARVGDHFAVAAEVETRFSKMSTNAKVYAAWTW